jgi:hypothetical protein
MTMWLSPRSGFVQQVRSALPFDDSYIDLPFASIMRERLDYPESKNDSNLDYLPATFFTR